MAQLSLEFFLELDKEIRLASDEDRLCERAVVRTAGFLAADNGSIMLLTNTRSLRIAAGIGLPESIRKALFTLEDGPAGLAVRSRQPLLIQGSCRSEFGATPNFHSARSSLVAPLLTAEHVLGAINLSLVSSERNFSEEDLQVLSIVANRLAVAIENHRLLTRERETFLSTVRALMGAVEAKDPFTAGHCERTAAYATAVAQRVGLSPSKVEEIRLASLLHDVGKIGIPESILFKPASLTAEEFRTVTSHPERGYLIACTAGLPDACTATVRHHHERIDGKGYPLGLANDAIPVGARILAVVDTYDAMTSTRPYREALSHEEAVKEMIRVSGHQLDTRFVGAFLSCCEEPGLVPRKRPSPARPKALIAS